MWLQNPSGPRTDLYFGVPQCKNSYCACYEKAGELFPRHHLSIRLGPFGLVASLPLYMMLVMETEIKGIRAPDFFLF